MKNVPVPKPEPVGLDTPSRWKIRRPGLTPAHLLVRDVEIGPACAWTADGSLGVTDVDARLVVERGLSGDGCGDGDMRPEFNGDANGGARETKPRDPKGHPHPGNGHREHLTTLPRDGLGSLRNEARQLQTAREQYGWLSHLRLPDDVGDQRKVRWM